MREIKFRAFHEPTKQMFDVFSFDVNNVRAWYPEKYGLEISPDREDCILMQYTGLKDKSGVEIYEGDIVRVYWLAELCIEEIDCEGIGVVEYMLSEGRYIIKLTKPFIRHIGEIGTYEEEYLPLIHDDRLGNDEQYFDYEIIGNEYETPELLEMEAEK